MKILVIYLTLFFLVPYNLEACTSFCFVKNNRVIFGKNYDWNVDVGYVYINKRNIHKLSEKDDNEKDIEWTSKYGSITFNQYGREFPSGGINEAGLIIELMWLDETKYPIDNRPSVGSLQWIQFQLDQSVNITDIIENSKKLRIKSFAKIHFLVSDSNGNSYTVEYLDGKLHSEKANVLTNSTIKSSKKYLANNVNKQYSQSSFDRFCIASEMIRNHHYEEPVSYGFSILDAARQGSSTKWSIIYDFKLKRIHFKTNRYPGVKTIQLDLVDFSNKTAVTMFDMNQNKEGEIDKYFINYDRLLNESAIRTAFRATRFTANLPENAIIATSFYPERFTKALK